MAVRKEQAISLDLISVKGFKIHFERDNKDTEVNEKWHKVQQKFSERTPYESSI